MSVACAAAIIEAVIGPAFLEVPARLPLAAVVVDAEVLQGTAAALWELTFVTRELFCDFTLLLYSAWTIYIAETSCGTVVVARFLSGCPTASGRSGRVVASKKGWPRLTVHCTERLVDDP